MKDAFYDSEFSKSFRGADDPLPSNRPTPYSNQPRKPNPTLYSNYAPRSVPHTFLLSNLSLCSGKVMPNLFLQTITWEHLSVNLPLPSIALPGPLQCPGPQALAAPSGSLQVPAPLGLLPRMLWLMLVSTSSGFLWSSHL